MKPADLVKPPLIAECPVNFECKINEIKSLGEEGGAGNLVICEVIKIHIREEYLNEEGNLDQRKLDLVARLGGNWYSRNTVDNLFEVPKPLVTKGIGLDKLPEQIRYSIVLPEMILECWLISNPYRKEASAIRKKFTKRLRNYY